MSLRRQLLQSVLVQGCGAAALLLAVIWIGVRQGPEAQGLFNRTKAEVELVAAFAMFGLPQALFYFVKQGRISQSRAQWWATMVALLSPVWAVAYAMTSHGLPGSLGTTAMFAVACAACVLHGQLRTLVLAVASSRLFSVITTAPQVLILIAAVIWAESGRGGMLLVCGLALSFLLPAAAAWQTLASTRQGGVVTDPPVDRSELLRHGAASWLAAVLAAASVVIVQRGVEHAAGAVALGLFTMALTLSQVPLMPVNYATPLLFRHWIAWPEAKLPLRPLSLLLGALLVLAALLQLLAVWRPDLWLGARYPGLAGLLALLLVGTAGEATLRVAGARLNAAGRPWGIVQAEAMRCTVLIGLLSSGMAGDSVTAFGLYWVVSSWMAAALIVGLLGRGPTETRS